MHARLDELLSLRDGDPVDAAVTAHVRGCAACTARLADSERLRERLRALPGAPSPAMNGWPAVREGLARRGRWQRRTARYAPVAAAAALGALALLATLRSTAPDPPVAAAPRVVDPALHELQARSQALETLLAALPARPAVERAATSLPIESLQDQVQWLDHQITLADAGDAAAPAERLWGDRVEVLSSLVQLRYVEAQSTRQ
jgi:hypothetical protein